MKQDHFNYFVCCILLFCGPLFLHGQSSNATVTIIGGDPVIETEPSDPSPPSGSVQLAEPQNIEPTLENGFHIRYRIDTPQKEEDSSSANEYASLSTSIADGRAGTKIKKRNAVTVTALSFNLKKRFKSWMPKRKKTYRPHVCGRF